MDILKTVLGFFIKKQTGSYKLIKLIIIAIAFMLGLFVTHYSAESDSPIEQIAEDVLEDYGIDIDFSKDFKDKDKSLVVAKI